MDNLMALDTKSSSLDDARDCIKALAPWINDRQMRILLRDESCRRIRSAYSVPILSMEVWDDDSH
jgi:hypothetical protein